MTLLLMIVSLLLSHAADGRSADHTVSPVKTIHREDGDVIDCVDIYSQPSLQHPLLKDHVIQMKPSSYAKGIEGSSTRSTSEPPQAWGKISCPNGTIPILRRKPVNQKTIEQPLLAKNYDASSSPDVNDPGFPHEYVVMWPDKPKGYGYFGTYTTINVWNPHVQVPQEYSMSRLALAANGDAGSQEVLFAGVHVYPDLYGDNNTRIFISTIATNVGCYNLDCPGFVQVEKTNVLGSIVRPVSIYEGPQYNLSLKVYKDSKTSNWWLEIEGTPTGYWPASLFNYLKNYATHVEWGGEVVNSNPGGHHTATQMGNGYFPFHARLTYELLGKVARISNICYINGDGVCKFPDGEITNKTKSNCYAYVPWWTKDENIGYTFFYGGPGGSDPGCT